MSILKNLILSLPFVRNEISAIVNLVNVENAILKEAIKKKNMEIAKLKQDLKKYGA